ncbi:hemicentin-2-like protein [Lates japonicus]|uniref:B-cell receptor CD22 n=1 Tax=Lates japonicus TaxID=270547 RepID=A0AAD3R8B7_LATJO|nr:hemicentin-2-like protein [Lates japonicus]
MVTSEKIKTGETMLRVLGCCEWYALPEGPVDAVSGKNVTFKTLINPKEEFNAIAWFVNNGSGLMRIVTVSKEWETIVSEGYLGRVKVNHTNGFLTLGSLAAEDSGDYYVNIFTAKGVKTGETKLQVLEPVSDVTIRANVSEIVEVNSTVALTCSAKGSFLKFSWTNGATPIVATNTRLTIKEEDTSSMLTIHGSLASDLVGPIYCIARNHLEVEKSAPFNLTVIFPPPAPVLTTQPSVTPGKARWSVTFENPDPCALKGSSAQLWCSFNYPDGETVHKTVWFRGEVKNGSWRRTELSSLPSYQNRVKYLGDQKHNCSLEIHDLRDSDIGYYYFRFDTNTYGWRSKGSVYLSVTGLTARVQPDSVIEGQTVTLTCDTSCKLSRPTPVVWFRNGQPVAKPSKFQASAEDAGNYTCAVEGQESVQSNTVFLDVHYAPVNVSVAVSLTGSLVEGSSVNLTCSSTANPAADRYSWYRRTASSTLLQVGSGQVLSLPSVELSHAGLYLCQAKNPLGENNSTEVLLEVDVSETSLAPTDLPAGDEDDGELRTSSHVTTSSHTTMSPYTTQSSHAMASSHTTMSPYTTTSLQPTTTQRDTDTRLDNQDLLDTQRAWFDKLHVELMEMRQSFERSLRQMESRTHSLLWSMSRRLERMTEALDRNSAPSHHKTFVSLRHLLPSSVSAVTPSSQPPGSRSMNLHNKAQRTRRGRKGSRS